MRRRHLDVDDRSVRSHALDETKEGLGVLGLTDDLESTVGEQPDETCPHEGHVLGDHDAHGTLTSMVTSTSGALDAASAVQRGHAIERVLEGGRCGGCLDSGKCDPQERARRGTDESVTATARPLPRRSAQCTPSSTAR